MNRSALILLVMVVSSSVGCESTRRAGFPRQSYDEKKLIIKLEKTFKLTEKVTEYYTEKKKKDADLKKLRGMRDEFINSRIALINLNYIQFVSEFAVNKQTIDTLSEMGVLGLNLAGTAVVSAATKTTLSAISAGIAGAHVSINKNFFYEKTVPVLVTAMNARRKEALLPIEKGIQKSDDEYPLIVAISDLDRYYFAGTFIGALQAMQKNAAEKGVTAEDALEVERDKQFATREAQNRVDELLDSVEELPAGTAWSLLKAPPAEIDEFTRNAVKGRLSGKTIEESAALLSDAANDDNTKAILKMVLVLMIDRSPENIAKWKAAIQSLMQ